MTNRYLRYPAENNAGFRECCYACLNIIDADVPFSFVSAERSGISRPASPLLLTIHVLARVRNQRAAALRATVSHFISEAAVTKPFLSRWLFRLVKFSTKASRKLRNERYRIGRVVETGRESERSERPTYGARASGRTAVPGVLACPRDFAISALLSASAPTDMQENVRPWGPQMSLYSKLTDD
jgi:hypothetical protein